MEQFLTAIRARYRSKRLLGSSLGGKLFSLWHWNKLHILNPNGNHTHLRLHVMIKNQHKKAHCLPNIRRYILLNLISKQHLKKKILNKKSSLLQRKNRFAYRVSLFSDLPRKSGTICCDERAPTEARKRAGHWGGMSLSFASLTAVTGKEQTIRTRPGRAR